jgi:hypothetical protein
MATVARRISSAGTISISGEFDEVSLSAIRLTTGNYYAAQFDEVTLNGGAVAMRETSTGIVLAANGFDEVNKPT